MQTRAPIPTWVLVVVSCCAAVVALAFIYVSFTLGREAFALYADCYAQVEPRLSMIKELQATWLLWGIAGSFSWYCAYVARRRASASTRGLRHTTTALLWLSSLALVGFALAFGWFQLYCYQVA
jgi:hypothetical protein